MWRKTFVRHRITVPYKFPLGAITSMVKPFDCDDLKKYYFANFYPTPGVTTVQYLTTSLQSSKLLGRTLGLKYNHKSLHKSQFIVIYIRYIAELANVTFVQDVHDNISSGNGTSSKMLHHMIKVRYALIKKTILFGNFSQHGGGVFPNPKTFVNLPSIFLYAKFILRC